jgi:hypothetical protein
MQRSQFARWGDFENCATARGIDTAPAIAPSFGSGPIEVTVGTLTQRSVRKGPVSKVEAVQRGQLAAWGNLEDRATGIVAAVWILTLLVTGGRPVEVSVGTLNQCSVGVETIISWVEAVECR